MADQQLSELPKVDIGAASPVANVVAPAPSAIPEQPTVPPVQLGSNPVVPPLKSPDPAPQFSTESIEKTVNKDFNPNNDQAQKALGVINKTLIKPTPENKLELARHIEEKNALDQDGHINTHAQWGGVIASLIKGDYMNAWKFYNGGFTRLEDAYSPVYGHAYKEFNGLGTTGKIFSKDGKEIPFEVLNQIEKKGGYFQSKSDTSALQDSRYQAANQLVKEAMTGMPEALLKQTSLAQQMAGTMSQVADGASQLKKLVMKKGNDFLDNFSKLNSQQRQDFLSLTNTYFGQNQNASSGQAVGNNGSFTGQTGATNSVGGSLNGGFGGSSAVPPSGNNPGSPKVPGIGVDLSGNMGTSASNSATNSANATANATKAQGENTQTQQSLQDRISGYLGGQPLNAEQFQDLQSYLSIYQTLNSAHNELAKNNLLAPGSALVSAPDPRISGKENAFIFANDTARNAALASAYANYKTHLLNVNGGMLPPADEVVNGFMDSKTFKAIDNHFKQNFNNFKNKVSDQPQHKVGDIAFNPQKNRPVQLKENGKWEFINE